MKIWIVNINDDVGPTATPHFTEAEAEADAAQTVAQWWKDWKLQESPPESWRDALSEMQEMAGMVDGISVTEHDIGTHPCIAAAVAVMDRLVEDLGTSEEAACNDATMELAEKAQTAIREAVWTHEREEPKPEEAPEHWSIGRYREAAAKAHHREGEIEIDDRAEVNPSEDGGAYVQAWIWVSAGDAGVALEEDVE